MNTSAQISRRRGGWRDLVWSLMTAIVVVVNWLPQTCNHLQPMFQRHLVARWVAEFLQPIREPLGCKIKFRASRRKSLQDKEISKCERQELNLHGFPHWILSPARLPIPPLSRKRCCLIVCDIFSPPSRVVTAAEMAGAGNRRGGRIRRFRRFPSLGEPWHRDRRKGTRSDAR
jgi:hypothetical protein